MSNRFSQFTVALLFALSFSVFAGGFQLYCESAPDMLGTAGAGVAAGGRASSAWYSPAATIDIDRPTVTAGGSLIRLTIDYKTSTSIDNIDEQPRLTGFFYSVLPLNDDMRLNLAVNAPYGMITQWAPSSPLSELATYTNLRVCYISPSLTYRVTDQLSLAAGPNVTIGVARFSQYINMSDRTGGMFPNNKAYLSADDIGLGGFLAAYFKFNDEWAFAGKYQSKVHMTFKGESDYRYHTDKYTLPGYGPITHFIESDLKGHIDMPASLALGIRNNSIERWTFLFDAVWTQWSSYKDLNMSFDTYPGTTHKGKTDNPRDWDDVWSYHLGAEYQLTPKWLLRCGLEYDNSPANHRYISPEMPDSDKWVAAVGVGYQDEHWGFDLSYGFTHFNKVKLGTETAKTAGPAGGPAERGLFKTECHILSFSLTFKY